MGRGIICIGHGGLGKAFSASGVRTYDRRTVDVNNIDSIRKVLLCDNPRYVLNCSGIVGTGRCENNPAVASAVNVGGAANLALACFESGASLVHFSTIYVGDFNVYTRTKLNGENVVKESRVRSYIIRIPWMFGMMTKNFIYDAAIGQEVSIYEDEHGYLAYDNDIVQFTLDTIGDTGTVSIANAGQVAREDVLRYMKAKFSYIDRSSNMPRSVHEPTIMLRPWKEPLKEFIDGLRSV